MEIHVLSDETINRIAAGEVVERPVGVVKELVENAIDAGATAITCEIREGGIKLIRVTDNGCGIERDQIQKAFTRHATSKIQDENDLMSLHTLGFRGEALSSIASVAQVEMVTKTRDSIAAVRATNQVLAGYDPNEPVQLDLQEIGAPDGTSVIVRNLFYNVPVRRKFLRQPQTEAGYITDLIEHQALSHPDISFHYRVNGQEKLHTTGNGSLKELIYRIYGKAVSKAILPVKAEADGMRLEGFIGRPEISRSSRGYEVFFVNGRMLRSPLLSKALEEGYRTDLMQHRFPFAVLHLTLPPETIDVNIHPNKMEIRFAMQNELYDFIDESVHQVLHRTELIPKAQPLTAKEQTQADREEKKRFEQEQAAAPHTEAFEQNRLHAQGELLRQVKQSVAAEQGARYRTGKAGAGTVSAPARQPAPAPSPAPAAPGGMQREQESAPKEQSVEQQKPDTAQKGPAGGQKEEDDFFFDDRRPVKPAGPAAGGTMTGSVACASPAPAVSPAPAPAASAVPSPAPEPAGEAVSEPARQEPAPEPRGTYEQASLFPADDFAVDPESGRRIMREDALPQLRIVGQVFDTYWIVEYQEKMLLIDQHAADEKVNYERLMARMKKDEEGPAASQMMAPPVVLTLTGKEEGAYLEYRDVFRAMGYDIEDLGDRSYAIRAVPLELYGNAPDALLREVLDEILGEKLRGTPQSILSRIATMSCKAAVKGSRRITEVEARVLIQELIGLDNPYHCPHGRPTMIEMSKSDLDRRFKRLV